MARQDRVEEAAGALDDLDRLLEQRVRLAACTLLARRAHLSFSRLKELLDETDGNLGAHLRRLEDAGYLDARKEFVDRRPVTWYSLTPKGERALQRHVDALSRLVGELGGGE